MSNKKFITLTLSLLVVLVVAFVCFAGCDSVYKSLNKIINDNYDNITVTITTEQDGFTLTSTFSVKNTNGQSIVNYSVQNFLPIDANAGVSGDGIETKVGTVILKDGKVVEQTGDPVDITFGDVTNINLHFSESNLADVTDENGIFSAKVTNPQRFMDSPSLTCSDMTVMFAYEGSANYTVVIRYLSEAGAAVTINYTFA